MKEVWKKVKGYERYEISNLGRVFDSKKQILKLPSIKNHGRLFIWFDRKKQFYISRLVADAFIPNLLHKPQVQHLDNDPRNNVSLNLVWGTDKENMEYCVKCNRICAGEKQGRHKLNKKEVLKIRKLASKYSQYKLADMFRVTQGNIGYIIRRESWVNI